MSNNTSPHILGTAANLLGFCLVVITSLHLANKTENTIIDELTSVIAILLSCSCGFSFASIRTKNAVRERSIEKIAEYLFFASLAGIVIVIILISLNFLA
jgi:hypothetical protein